MAQQANEGTEDGADYSQWKGWGADGAFGRVTAGDRDYFRRELRSAVAGRTITDVLEVGFGDGQFLGYGREQGWTMVGTELSGVQVDLARAAGFDAHGPDHVASLPDASLDLIVLFDVLEHIEQDAIVEFLGTLRSKLRPTGMILLRYPNADTWLGNPLQHGDPTHVTQIGYFKLTFFAEAAGLNIISYRAPVRQGFRTSVVHGLHRITAGPVIAVTAAIAKALYYPGTPLVFSSHNAVAVLGVSE